MNNKFNRVVATGLLALMIANFSACKEGNVISGTTDNNDTTTTGQNQTIVNPTQGPKGDVWEAMKVKGTHIVKSHLYDYSQLSNQPLPIQFLEDEGLLYHNHSNRLCINDKQPSNIYKPLQVDVYVDNNTPENDVYVLVNYRSDVISSETETDVFVTTWNLKYTLADDDYQTLLALKGDYRQRFFIQEMDYIYEPQVVSKATTTQQIVQMGSPNISTGSTKVSSFPYIYVDSYDVNNKTIRYATKVGDGYKYYETSLYESLALESIMNEYNLTLEECIKYMEMTTQSSLVGSALIRNHVANRVGGIGKQKIAQKIEDSNEQVVWESLDVNSQENNVEFSQ